MRKKLIIILLVIIVIFVFINGCVEEKIENNKKTILYVGNSEGFDYKNIQEAINNSENGTKIYVEEGIYKELIVIDKSIELIGEGRDKTIFDFTVLGEIGQITGIEILSVS